MILNLILEQKENKARGKKFEARPCELFSQASGRFTSRHADAASRLPLPQPPP
jgi:hypothetical protein